MVEMRWQKQQLDNASFHQLGLHNFLIERLHDLFVGTGIDGGLYPRQVALSVAEHDLWRIAIWPCAQFLQEAQSVEDRHFPVEQH